MQLVRQRSFRALGSIVVALGLLATSGQAQPASTSPLSLGEPLKRSDLRRIISGHVSPDGRHVYMATFRGFIQVLRRDPESSRLKVVSTVAGRPNFEGATDAQVSPNGRYVVTTAATAGAVVLFSRDQESGGLSLLRLPDGQHGIHLPAWRPREAVFSPDSQFVYIADERGGVAVFRIVGQKTLEEVQTNIEPPRQVSGQVAGVNGIAMHPDGETLFAIALDSKALMVLNRDRQTGRLTVRQTIPDAETSMHGLSSAVDVAVSPDGRFIYTNSGNLLGDYGISVFQLSSSGRVSLIQEFFDGEERLRDTLAGNDLVVSPDGRYLYVCSKRRDKLISLRRDLGTGRLSQPQAISIGEAAEPQWVTGLCITPDGKTLYAGTELDETLLTFTTDDVEPAAVTGPAPPPAEPTRAAEQRPAANTGPSSEDEVARLTGHTGPIIGVAFSPDGRRAVSGSWDGTVRIWDLTSGAQLHRIEASERQILAMAYSADGRLVAAAGVDNIIRLWDAQSAQQVRQLRGSGGFVSGLAFSPDGKRLLSVAGDRKVRLWEVSNGEELRIFDQTVESPDDVAFAPNGRLALCSGGYFSNTTTPLGEMLRVWDVDSGEVVFRLRPKIRSVLPCAVFSPDSRRVAAHDLDGNGLGIWDLKDGRQVQLLRGAGSIQDLVFSHDGRFILWGNVDRVLVVREIDSGRTVREYRGHTGSVQAVAISPDGRHALTGSADKTLRLWRLPEALAARAPKSTPLPPPAEGQAPAADSSRRPEDRSSQQKSPPAPGNPPPPDVDVDVRPSRPTPAEPKAPADNRGRDVEERRDVRPAVSPNASSQPPEQAVVLEVNSALARAQRASINLGMLLRSYGPNEAAEREKLLSGLFQAKPPLEQAARRLSEIETVGKEAFRLPFTNLPALPNQQWRIGLPRRPLLKEIPEEVAIVIDDGKTILRQGASSTAYQALLDYPLVDGARLRIRFSLPQPRGGFQPRYFGLRGEAGQEYVPFGFPVSYNSDEVHEILLERQGDRYTSMYQERMNVTIRHQVSEFKDPPLAFFRLNPNSEVVVHSVHASPQVEKPSE